MTTQQRPDLPNIRHMLLFYYAQSTGSISKAADKMFLTQPAASQGIAKLEKHLGVPLLVRQGKRMSATDQGEIFANRAERAFDDLRAGLKSALHHSGKDTSRRDQLLRNLTSAQLRALIAIGRHGSFTVAAKSLDLAQPTVHRTAKALEHSCGFPIFRKTANGIDLTDAGRALYQRAKLARAELQQAREELSQIDGLVRKRFVLGSLPLARAQIVPLAITDMLDKQKELQVRVIEGRYSELLRGLREGDIDCLIGALRAPAPAEDVTEERLFDDDLAIICAPAHPLATKANCQIDHTLAYPWIAPPVSTPAGQYLFQTLDIENKAQTPVRVVASSFGLLKELLGSGDFLTVISRTQVIKELEAGSLVALDIALTGQRRAIGLTLRKNWLPTASQGEFLQALRKASDRVHQGSQ